MSWWDRYVLRPRVRAETSGSETVPHIGPYNVTEARRISRRSKAFTVIKRQLYKRSISQILEKCIDEKDGKALLLEIHEGTYGHHASSRVLVSKAFRAGFYWPIAMKNAEDIVRRCVTRQKFANRPHAPASELKT